MKTASHLMGKSMFLKDKYVPKFVKLILKYMVLFVLDIKHYILHGFKSGIPAPTLSNMEASRYKEIGEEFFSYFKDIGDLKSSDSVLDVGCGFGRLGLPLVNYLCDGGQYHGFDIIKSQVTWAQNNISDKYPNFHFKHIDVRNDIYSENGVRASEFTFPYESQTFDFVFLNSVFTHMLPKDVEHYLSEIYRVLRPGGRCLITYFLLNEHSTNAINGGLALIDFKHKMDGFMTNDLENVEEAIAFDESYVRNLYSDVGLSIVEPVRFGSWSDRQSPLSFQDIIVAKRG